MKTSLARNVLDVADFQCDADLNLLPSLPLSNLNDLKEFDMQLSKEVCIKEQMV